MSQNYLIVYIALDELKENPGLVLAMVQAIAAPYLAKERGNDLNLCRLERELLRLAVRNNRVLRPFEAARQLEAAPKTIVKYAQQLVARGKLRAVRSGASGRVNRYEYIGPLLDPDIYG